MPEFTESQLMLDPDHAIRVMRALCDAGMRIAIDDFGTGYSSLAYLTRFDALGAREADERVAPEALAADDRFQEIRVRAVGELEVDRERLGKTRPGPCEMLGKKSFEDCWRVPMRRLANLARGSSSTRAVPLLPS